MLEKWNVLYSAYVVLVDVFYIVWSQQNLFLSFNMNKCIVIEVHWYKSNAPYLHLARTTKKMNRIVTSVS